MEQFELYINLFISFFKIGLFGFGGGYAMLSLIKHEVVEVHQWLSVSEFTDIIAISQMTPGPIGINSATFVGYTASGSVWGSIVATFAICLPSFIIMLLVAHYFLKFRRNRHVNDMFSGLRPVVVGLIAAAGLQLMNHENFIDWISILFFVLAFVIIWRWKTNPIYVIIGAGIAGWLVY